jgi:uncharacterized protein (DUF2345 family)
MSQVETRVPGRLPHPGPYMAEITNNLDPTYMGSVEVALIKNQAVPIDLQSRTFVVKWSSPFFGYTSSRYEGNNSGDFNDVQKSYGMWMVPPDVGTKVLVVFLLGNASDGYVIGCIPETFQNHMVPGIAASDQASLTAEQERRYGTKYLPVAEIHKASQTLNENKNPYFIKKPVHPFAERLLAQGLLLDTVRGVTSSSARRETPSKVFGISTPGPLDESDGAKKGKIGYAGNRQFYVSRLGGHSFVMDDGDLNGADELVRIRTRTGHQILLHNSHDLIYIANSKGTAWIEMTSAGKIDIYAEDSVSIHTEADFNFRADRDVNLEAGRNINMLASNNFNLNVKEDFNLIVDQSGKLQFGSVANISSKTDIKLNALTNLHVKSNGSIFNTAGENINLLSNNGTYLTTNGDTNISSAGSIFATGFNIHLNGPTAAKATTATDAEQPVRLPLFNLPNRDKQSGWADGNFYNADPITSIMQRVPTHEPWDQHENINPDRFNKDATDAYAGANNSNVVTNQPWPEPNNNQPSDWIKDELFINKVKSVASGLGCDYIDLLACMAFETGRTFDPAKRNPKSSATGLIQFMSSTAKSLGTTTQFLAGLTRTQQMDWVEKYFKSGPLAKVASPKIEDIYMSILWPAAVGKSNDYVLFRAGTPQYALNPLDKDGKGFVTKADASTKVKAQLAYVRQQIVNYEASKTKKV